ncbi:MAG TPA: ABC transporter ATP-binding protein [Streptosporangiaceae bacterium]|nr:ABC transporter ATP-binding protein [Streptosporangiaceae bacterium]
MAALWRLRGYLRPYYGQLAFMLAAALLGALAEIVIPLLAKAAIDGPIAAAAAGDSRGHGLLVPIGIGAIGLGATEVAFNVIRRWVQATAVVSLEQSMRDDLYAHLQRLEPGFHDAWQSGQLLSRGTTDLSAIRRFAGFGVVFMITSIVSFIVIVLLLIRLNPPLGLLTAAVLAPVTALCLRFERRYRVLSRRVQDQQDFLATYVEEAAAGIGVLKALGRRRQAASEHAELARSVYQTQISKARLRGTFWASLDLVPNVAIALILLLGALAVSRGDLTTGGLVAFIALVLMLVWPIEAMGYILALGQEAATAAQRVYEILDTQPAIVSPPEAEKLPRGLPGASGRASSRRAVPKPRAASALPGGSLPAGPRTGGKLVFDHVGFSYPGSSQPVLRDVCLELTPGETVALVGATGSGKTTLLSLIVRLADTTSGTIWLDGTDIRHLPLRALRTAVACAFEDPTLFSVSVRENVTLGRPDAPADAVEAALAAAQADFVDGLPWGLETRIGEQGMSLSGGQRQRIALARAILASPSVLLLDDPLSALDVHTEAKVTQALGQVLANSTALVVAHRPSTVALADRVAVLERGKISAIGTHRELLAGNSHYQHLMSTDAEAGAWR